MFQVRAAVSSPAGGRSSVLPISRSVFCMLPNEQAWFIVDHEKYFNTPGEKKSEGRRHDSRLCSSLYFQNAVSAAQTQT